MRVLGVLFFFISFSVFAHTGSGDFWMQIKAKDKFERSAIANMGYALEEVRDDHVVVMGTDEDYHKFSSMGILLSGYKVQEEVIVQDFPAGDDKFHDHHEVMAVMDELQSKYPDIIKVNTVGMSIEGRIIPQATLTVNPETHLSKPGIVFLGAHHAREHLSVEVPIRHLVRLCEEYENGNEEVVQLLQTRSLYFIPLVNPDGKAHDIKDGRYKMWRKNRRLFGSIYGVDLNRNYSFQWGTGGSSTNPRSDVYMGPEPFSEPETRAVRDFVTSHENLTILLTYHTFGKLILYPWGHKYDEIGNESDFQIHRRMAEKMSEWNGYSPQQSSSLYVASGDTTDWSYGELGLISFTFELDPGSRFRGGFYPGAGVIDDVVEKNWLPALYLTDLADNPNRVLEGE